MESRKQRQRIALTQSARCEASKIGYGAVRERISAATLTWSHDRQSVRNLALRMSYITHELRKLRIQ